MRAWIFLSNPAGIPRIFVFSILNVFLDTGSTGSASFFNPRFLQSASESVTDSAEENCEGHYTEATFSVLNCFCSEARHQCRIYAPDKPRIFFKILFVKIIPDTQHKCSMNPFNLCQLVSLVSVWQGHFKYQETSSKISWRSYLSLLIHCQ